MEAIQCLKADADLPESPPHLPALSISYIAWQLQPIGFWLLNLHLLHVWYLCPFKKNSHNLIFSGEQEKYHLDVQMTREGKSDKLVG